MATPVQISELRVAFFRNLTTAELRPGPALNLLHGENGQGKTSLLEAIYLAATSKSFRTERAREGLQNDATSGRILLSLRESDWERQQEVLLSGSKVSFRADGRVPPSLADYATATPVVVFHPGDLELVAGGPEARRRLLDRVALYMSREALEARRQFLHAQKERRTLLLNPSPSVSALEAYEAIMAQSGASWTQWRRRAADAVGAAACDAFRAMAPAGLELGSRYCPGGSDQVEEARRVHREQRARDALLRRTGYGPHRDDWELVLGGTSARQQASQGQQRLATLAIKLAELRCIEKARGANPILLLDDVSSELDAQRTDAVLALLGGTVGQVFVTSTRPELFQSWAHASLGARCFRVHNGSVFAEEA